MTNVVTPHCGRTNIRLFKIKILNCLKVYLVLLNLPKIIGNICGIPQCQTNLLRFTSSNLLINIIYNIIINTGCEGYVRTFFIFGINKKILTKKPYIYLHQIWTIYLCKGGMT